MLFLMLLCSHYSAGWLRFVDMNFFLLSKLPPSCQRVFYTASDSHSVEEFADVEKFAQKC